jgi:hypothetical protein
MRWTNSYLLIIVGICVISVGVAFSLTQSPESNLSDGELASITIGCNYQCVFSGCASYESSCSTLSEDYCTHTWANETHTETHCPNSGGSARGCMHWDYDMCHILWVCEKHPTYGCEPTGEGHCQGTIVTAVPDQTYAECGERT